MNPHIQRAQILIQQHRCADAEKELGLALGDDPDDAWAHALLALCLADRKAYTQASLQAQRAISHAPDSARIRQLAARVEYARDAYDQAEQLYTEAIQLDPYDGQSFSGRGAVHADRKHWKKALADASSALELDPENIEAINIRSLANRGLGRSGEGQRDMRQALHVDPNDARSHANLGWSHLEQHELDKAEHHFREALRLDPTLEWARVGVLETTKARFPIYRWLLSYFLWMAKLTGQAQMAIIFGLWFVNRIVRGAAAAYPDWAPVLLPITWFYLLFCVMTWFIQPLSNATLLLHPFARMALNRREKTEALVVGGLFILVLGLIIGSIFDPTGICQLLALGIGVPALPLAMTWKFHHPQPQRIMLAMTAGVLVAEVAFFAQVALEEGRISSIPAPFAGLALPLAQLFIFSPLIVLIATNVMATKNWTRN